MTRIIALIVALALSSPAWAHDVYDGLHSGFDQNGEQTFQRHVGNLCCNGDPVTGDCEPLDDFVALPNGNYMISSKRWQRRVEVNAGKVSWSGVAGSEAMVHWCGKPRDKQAYPGAGSVTPDQPDPDTWTYCFFIVPGGV